MGECLVPRSFPDHVVLSDCIGPEPTTGPRGLAGRHAYVHGTEEVDIQMETDAEFDRISEVDVEFDLDDESHDDDHPA